MAASAKLPPKGTKHRDMLLYEALWESLDNALLNNFLDGDPRKQGLEEDRFFEVVIDCLLARLSYTSVEVNREVAQWRAQAQYSRRELLKVLRRMLCYGEDYTWDFYVNHLAQVLATETPNFVQRFRHRATVRCQRETNKVRRKLAGGVGAGGRKPLGARSLHGREGNRFVGLHHLRDGGGDAGGGDDGEAGSDDGSETGTAVGGDGAADALGGGTYGASRQRTDALLSIFCLPDLGDAWGMFLCVEQHGCSLRHGRDFEVIGRLPDNTTTLLHACSVDAPHYQLAISYENCGIHLLNLQERTGDAIKIKYVLQAAVPQHSLIWSTKTGRLLSGGSTGEICVWSMQSMAAFTGQIRPVSASDMLLANDMIETRGFHRDIYMAAQDFNMENRASRDVAKFMLALMPLFGLSHGQALWLSENQAQAHLYLGALAQVRDIPPRVFRNLVSSCIPWSQKGAPGGGGSSGVLAAAPPKDSSLLAWSLKVHGAAVTWLLFGDNKNFLITASRDGTVAVIDMELRQKLYSLKGHVRGVTQIDFARGPGLLASVGYSTDALVWDLNNPVERPVSLVDTAMPHTERVVRVLFVPDMPQVVTCDQKGLIKIWDYRTLSGPRKMTAAQNIDTAVQLPPCDRRGHFITSMAYMHRSQLLVLIGRNLCFYEPKKLTNPNAAGEGPAVEVNYNAYSGRYVTITGGHLTLWDAERGTVISAHTIADPQDEAATPEGGINVTCACTFPDSAFTIIGTSKGALALVRSNSGHIATQLRSVHDSAVVGIAACTRPNGVAYVVSVDKSGVVALCTKSLKLVFSHRLNARRDDVLTPSCLCDCPATSQIAVGSTDGTLVFFDPATLANVGILYKVKTSFSELISLVQIGKLPCIAVSSSLGEIGLWGMKPYVYINESPIVKWFASPKDRHSTRSHSDNSIASPMSGRDGRDAAAGGAAVTTMRCVDHWLYTGDEEGKITAWSLDTMLNYTGIPGIMARMQDTAAVSIHHVKSKRGYQTVRPAWSRQIYNCDVLCIQPLPPQYLLTSSNDGRVFLIDAQTGDFLTSLAQGRGVRAIRRSLRVSSYDVASAPAPWKDLGVDPSAAFAACLPSARGTPGAHPSSMRSKRSADRDAAAFGKKGHHHSVSILATPSSLDAPVSADSDRHLPRPPTDTSLLEPIAGIGETGTPSPRHAVRQLARDGALPIGFSIEPPAVSPPEAPQDAARVPYTGSPVMRALSEESPMSLTSATEFEEEPAGSGDEASTTNESDAAAAAAYRRRRRQLKARLRDTHNPMTRYLVQRGHAPKVRPATARLRRMDRLDSKASDEPEAAQTRRSARDVVREPIVTKDQLLTLKLFNHTSGTRADGRYECSHRGMRPYLKDQKTSEEHAVRENFRQKEEARKMEHRFCFEGAGRIRKDQDSPKHAIRQDVLDMTATDVATCRRTPGIPGNVRRSMCGDAWGGRGSAAGSVGSSPAPAPTPTQQLFAADTPRSDATGGTQCSPTPRRMFNAATPVMIPSPPTRPPSATVPPRPSSGTPSAGVGKKKAWSTPGDFILDAQSRGSMEI